jgi:hypothetical protein
VNLVRCLLGAVRSHCRAFAFSDGATGYDERRRSDAHLARSWGAFPQSLSLAS